MNFDPYRHFTQSRVGLGHSGPSLPTKSWLSFAYDHAFAKDAITRPWELPKTIAKITTEILHTESKDRTTYLLRPDLGAKLDAHSEEKLEQFAQNNDKKILLVASNGLSSLAMKNHLENFLLFFLPLLAEQKLTLVGKRIFLVPNARVALVDTMGDRIKPEIALILIGERPGLSSADSLALYLTYRPHKACTNAERNCISNIRPPHGLSYEEASNKAIFLIKEALRRKLSGICLKEDAPLLPGKSKSLTKPA